MIASNIALRIIFISQIGVGALGNSFLLGLYTITLCIGPRMRPIDFLLIQLAFVNDLVLLSKGIPQTMAAFGLNNFLDDVGCKLVFYLHRVAQGLSLSTTCLLSGFQAIILSPRSSRWAELKVKIPKCIVPFCLLCWALDLLKNCVILIYIKGLQDNENITSTQDFGFCSASFNPSFISSLYLSMISLPDVVCLGIMVLTSGSMVITLYRHHQRIQNIHSTSFSSRTSPETRATQTIVVLVSMFISFYSLNCILVCCVHSGKAPLWLVHTSAFLAACFPACSPFVLITSDSQITKYSLAIWGKIKS
ncbi:vomeronasal type-1 receptor 1-like [Vombatus ursinus]|uniref:vomeronasal type-1 receptor 1-like n=1 Tax=Vombatus ursinus TaxID=29139 RepID=UPI000FFD680C|nr:vomeronasal type-1 receptor 1-like [Vombatus ursinus]